MTRARGGAAALASALALALALALAPAGRADAQTEAPTLDYSAIDRATVRVIAVAGVGTQRVDSQSGRARLMAVPDAGHGSGILVSADGIVVTARHVIEGARIVAVWLPGEARAYQATVVYEDESTDFAILAMQGTFTNFVTLAPLGRTLHVREQVHAIGYPLDARRTDPQSSQGIVSGVLPDGSLQLDISLNPGNSGGPLIDGDENVLGIVVARGAVEAGVQGVGVAVPAAPILAALATEVPSRIDAARAGLLAHDHGPEVAELVQLLVRVGATELIREVVDEMEHHGSSDLLDRLRRLESSTSDPEIQVLVAAYYWDAAAVILERGGGLMRASELPAGPDRDLASELLTRASRLAYAAARAAPDLERRSPFVRRIVYYFTDPAATAVPAAPAAILTAVAPTPGSPGARPSEVAAPDDARGAERPSSPHDPNHDHRLRVGGGLALVNQTSPGIGVGGGVGRFIFEGLPATVRAGIFAFDPILGVDFAVGAWGGFLLQLHGEIGGMVRLGDRFAAVVGVSWIPGLVIARSSIDFAVGGWRTYVGAQIEDVTIAVGWRGFSRENGYTLHEYEASFVIAFD